MWSRSGPTVINHTHTSLSGMQPAQHKEYGVDRRVTSCDPSRTVGGRPNIPGSGGAEDYGGILRISFGDTATPGPRSCVGGGEVVIPSNFVSGAENFQQATQPNMPVWYI